MDPEALQNALSGYKYNNMSNLVLQADRRFVARRGDEAGGDPESLAGRINIGDMGARVKSSAPTTSKRKQPQLERGDINEGADVLAREQKRNRNAGPSFFSDIQVEGLSYKPRTAATRATYDLIVTQVRGALGDAPSETVISAADVVLETLKDPELKDFDKKKDIDELLGTHLGNKDFNDLVNLGKKITDYYNQEEEKNEPELTEVKGPESRDLAERQGVAVNFDEDDDEEEDEDGITRTREVRDEGEDSDEELDEFANRHGAEDAATAGGAGDIPEGGVDKDGELVIDAVRADTKGRRTEDDDTIPAHEIDAFWLQRQVGHIFPDAHEQQQKTQDALNIMSGISEEGERRELRDVENDLMELFDYDHHELVAKLVLNRDRVVWVTRYRTAEDEAAREQIQEQMLKVGLRSLVRELLSRESAASSTTTRGPQAKVDFMDIDVEKIRSDVKMEGMEVDGALQGGLQPKNLIKLDDLIFEQGNHLMTNPNVKLPPGSTQNKYKGYEEIHVPPPKKYQPGPDDPKDIPVSKLPEWARIGFGSSKTLNRIQTRCFPTAFESDGNMLVCAPTGSGKTNVAMLAMLQEIGKHRDPESGLIDLDSFKIVYLAPLKALVAEQVGNFGKRLAPYGIKVSELTGDSQLTKAQIAETQLLVCTPEKWDVVTRKATDVSYTNLVRLICIDEIHLLHDDRGPVLESIVSRTMRKIEQTGDHVRIVGLSATLPNYRDVANFVRADPLKGVFHFDASFRPCPLQQEFVGVTDKKPIKQLRTMNEVCYKKVLEHVGKKRNQMLIFTHSRKDTGKTAKYIRDRLLEDETINQILRSESEVREILRSESETVSDGDLKDVMAYGFGIHHAGLKREDRQTVEDLFAQGHLQVLVCTATLAWGVNLPAHTVVIKGTSIYSPEKGSWVELSPQDVLQMLGRAGRPQYDTFGEGIIITKQTEMQYYMSLMNQQLPIESQMARKLVDSINAEIVLGNVRTRDDGVDWLGYTYLFVRMLRSPGLYSVGPDYQDDEALEQQRVDLIHSAATVLAKAGLAKYEEKSGRLQSTELGRIASHYYMSHNSMAIYNRHLQMGMDAIELFRVFSLSEEFKYIPVRQDEKLELAKLLGRVPIPIAESIEEPQAKINALLQAYISRLKLEGLALSSDMVYVTQSAGRILRAIFEICLRRGWAETAIQALELCKVAEKRCWKSMSPLRQFPQTPGDVPYVPREYITKAERVGVPWSNYYDLDPPRLGELLGIPKAGRIVHNAVEHFPRLDVQAHVQPITRSLLKFDLTISPRFQWNDYLHGSSEMWWIFIKDADGEKILFHDQFVLRKEYAIAENNEHVLTCTAMIDEPMPPNYFVHLVSDRWVNSETKLPVAFFKLVLPEKFPAHTPVLDMQPLNSSALKLPEYQELFTRFKRFNKIQTQTFQSLYTTDDNVFVGAPVSSGKTTCAEFALLRHWAQDPEARAVYIAPFQELIDSRQTEWTKRFGNLAGGKAIEKLTGEVTTDLRVLEASDLCLATPEQWDVVSRQWQRRKSVQSVKLFIADELHMLGGYNGHVYEVVVSRMQSIALQLETAMRIVGLSVPVASSRDMGEWIGATKHTIFNFSPASRPTPLDLHIQAFSIPHFPSLMLVMCKPMYYSILQHSEDKPAMVFLPGRKQVRQTAAQLLECCAADGEGNEDRFLNADLSELAAVLEKINERALAESISHGVGYFHEALSSFDKQAVQYLFQRGAIQVLLVSRDCCWEINSTAHLVVVMGTQYFEGREHRYIDYPIAEILQMFGKAGRPALDARSKGVLLVPQVRREYYRKFLAEALPVESQLQDNLHDTLVAEIASKTISSQQEALDWTTYTYLYRRYLANPSYYGIQIASHEGVSSHLSDTVEETLKDLKEANIIEEDEEEETIVATDAALIAAHYDISFITMQTFLLSLNAKTNMKALLEIVTSAVEFETIAIRRRESRILSSIHDRLRHKLSTADTDSHHYKVFVLLQAHFSRMQLPIDLLKDQELVLRRMPALLCAAVDVLSSEGHHNALRAMEMTQMVVQALWDRDSPLKQLPHFDDAQVAAAEQFGITDVFEFMDAMDPAENAQYQPLVAALGLSRRQLADAAAFTNDKYPSLELSCALLAPDAVHAGAPAVLAITIERETDDDDDADVDLAVHAPFFPAPKREAYWVAVADDAPERRTLHAVRRVTVARSARLKLEFTVEQPGPRTLTCYLIADSYMGVDQAPTFEVDVKEALEADSDEEDEDGDEEMGE